MTGVLTMLALSVDSGFGGAAVGLLVTRWRLRCAFAAAFGLMDGLATRVAGTWLQPPVPDLTDAETYGVVVLLAVAAAVHTRLRPLLWLLPVLFCLDNLSTPSPPEGALATGLASAAAAGIGICIGAVVRRAWRAIAWTS